MFLFLIVFEFLSSAKILISKIICAIVLFFTVLIIAIFKFLLGCVNIIIIFAINKQFILKHKSSVFDGCVGTALVIVSLKINDLLGQSIQRTEKNSGAVCLENNKKIYKIKY